ncbi:crotonase/enoyl-CoA hydratase family protein [Pseudomonas syringae]|uniref:crotonase/enoyl-CoA hydratase family protein n=1 Tax=Pseudomonas syringae TaxID=317 RepID=UPI003F7A52CD
MNNLDNSLKTSTAHPEAPKHFQVEHDKSMSILWGWFSTKSSTRATLELLSEMKAYDSRLITHEPGGIKTGSGDHFDFYVWASRTPGIFNLGGDLSHMVKSIRAKDREALLDYATLCVDVIYSRACNYNSTGMITLALVQGDALGGGFEAALANDVIIAEEYARFGLPEIVFNLFPGMGAYSLLSRRVGPRIAKDMMLSGKTYSASDCLEMGIIDKIVPKDQGVTALNEYVSKIRYRKNGIAGVYKARRTVLPITHEELTTITTQWVDAALRVKEKDLCMMMRLVTKQQHKLENIQDRT